MKNDFIDILKKKLKSDANLEIPVIPLRGIVVLPSVSVSFEVSRVFSVKALNYAVKHNLPVILSPQKDPDLDSPVSKDISSSGVVARIDDIIELGGDGLLRVKTETVHRVHLKGLHKGKNGFSSSISLFDEYFSSEEHRLEAEAYRRAVIKRLRLILELSRRPGSDMVLSVVNMKDPVKVCDIVASNLNLSFDELYAILSEEDILKRMNFLLVLMDREKKVSEFSSDIDSKVKFSFEESQREFFLREQLKIIRNELGEADQEDEEVNEYYKALEKLKISSSVKEQIRKEIVRLSKMPKNYPDAAVSRSYLDLVFDLPWGKEVQESLDIKKARKQLNKDHYGIYKVKERILEYLAVRARQKNHEDFSGKSPILCFVGPPGVGKTSVAISIAKALSRPYVRMSLGGVKDEADIRGHRKTYIGSMPGRIISGIKKAGVDNPVILLDEIDKIASDYSGDPASALLEVLDPEQNKAFHDHYLEIDYDLSHVLFLTTANSVETIPLPLLDRMEIIELNGYTEEEKYNIASKYLVPKEMKFHVLSDKDVRIYKSALMRIIRSYTREAGVRQLEQEIARMLRKISLRIEDTENISLPLKIDNREAVKILGTPRYFYGELPDEDLVGQAVGLAWTSVGGETLNIEAMVVPGSGKLELTGKLGEVMKESCKVAIAYIRKRSEDLGLPDNFASKNDIHIHVPEGAVPKDGPSAGVTIMTALYSAISGVKVKHKLAMTGELTIRGNVLPIGGLTEKLAAAKRANIKEVLIPAGNIPDLNDVPDLVKKGIKISPVKTAEEILKSALVT